MAWSLYLQFSGHDVSTYNSTGMIFQLTVQQAWYFNYQPYSGNHNLSFPKCLVIQINMLRCTPVCSYCMFITLVMLFLYFKYMLTQLINSIHIMYKPTVINSVPKKTNQQWRKYSRETNTVYFSLNCVALIIQFMLHSF